MQKKIFSKVADKKMKLTLQDITNTVEALEAALTSRAPPRR